MTDHLIETRSDGVVTLTMNRPESLNAFSSTMMAGLEEAVPRLAQDPDVKVVVLTGSGRAFSAGGDVKGFAGASGPVDPDSQTRTATSTFESRTASLRRATEVIEHLHNMPKPTIACIPGVVAGGGFSVALACDIRLATQSARFTTAFGKVGVSGDYGGSYFLTKLVGTAKARDLYFTSDIIGADEALRLNLVNHVFADDEFQESSEAYIRKVAAMPPIALSYMKRNLNVALNASLSEVLDTEAIHMTRTFQTEDHRIAARAFVEKREPEFRGR